MRQWYGMHILLKCLAEWTDVIAYYGSSKIQQKGLIVLNEGTLTYW